MAKIKYQKLSGEAASKVSCVTCRDIKIIVLTLIAAYMVWLLSSETTQTKISIYNGNNKYPTPRLTNPLEHVDALDNQNFPNSSHIYFKTSFSAVPKTQPKTHSNLMTTPPLPDFSCMDCLLQLPHRTLPKETPEKEKNHPLINFSQKRDYPVIISSKNTDSTFSDSKSKKQMNLLMAIKSSCPNIERRKAIRETWGNPVWNEKNTNFNSKLLFLIAACDNKNTKLSDTLKSENDQFQDIIQWDFRDSFQNLTVKECLFLQFVHNNITTVTHIFKGDDDIFVNPVAIGNLIKTQPDPDDVFIGSVLRGSPRITDTRSKYFVPAALWPETYYPAYVSGGGYVMSKSIADRLFLASLHHYLFPIDDAFIGVLLEEIGKIPTNYRKFRSWGNYFKGNMSKACYWHEQILTFHRRVPSDLRKTWGLYNTVMDKCKEDRKRRKKRRKKRSEFGRMIDSGFEIGKMMVFETGNFDEEMMTII